MGKAGVMEMGQGLRDGSKDCDCFPDAYVAPAGHEIGHRAAGRIVHHQGDLPSADGSNSHHVMDPRQMLMGYYGQYRRLPTGLLDRCRSSLFAHREAFDGVNPPVCFPAGEPDCSVGSAANLPDNCEPGDVRQGFGGLG